MSTSQKCIWAVFFALLFLLFCSPLFIGLLNVFTQTFCLSLFGDNGAPNMAGYILAAILYFLAIFALMYLF